MLLALVVKKKSQTREGPQADLVLSYGWKFGILFKHDEAEKW